MDQIPDLIVLPEGLWQQIGLKNSTQKEDSRDSAALFTAARNKMEIGELETALADLIAESDVMIATILYRQTQLVFVELS